MIELTTHSRKHMNDIIKIYQTVLLDWTPRVWGFYRALRIIFDLALINIGDFWYILVSFLFNLVVFDGRPCNCVCFSVRVLPLTKNVPLWRKSSSYLVIFVSTFSMKPFHLFIIIYSLSRSEKKICHHTSSRLTAQLSSSLVTVEMEHFYV